MLMVVIDLHVANVGGIHTARQFHFYCLYYFLYGGRGIFFALVSALILFARVFD
jgi:hypothetical protein